MDDIQATGWVTGRDAIGDHLANSVARAALEDDQ
jgi:hypothetical protein